MAMLGKIDQILAPKGISMTIAPFGAVCAVLFATPSSPGARVRFLSHSLPHLFSLYFFAENNISSAIVFFLVEEEKGWSGVNGAGYLLF